MAKLNPVLALAACGLLAALPTTAEAQTGAISGTVTDAETGEPVAGAFVRAQVSMVRGWNLDFTDLDGAYLIDELEEGTYEVTVTRFGYAQASTTVEVVDGETTTADFALVPPSYGTISGTVTDADTGDPLALAWVVVSAGWFNTRFDLTGDDGAYTLENVLTGDRVVRVWRWGYFSNTSEVEVLAGETTTNDVALDPLTFGTIAGTVTDAETGEAIENARVWAGWRSTRTDAAGAYSLEDVVTGDRTVRVTKWGYYTSTATVEVLDGETTTYDVALEPLGFGNVSGTITDATTGDPIAGARVQVGFWWFQSDYTDATGAYTIEDVLAADHTVYVSSLGYYPASTSVTVVDGETATADVALDPLTYGDVAGTVTDSETGDPISGARVQVGYYWWNSDTTNADGEYLIADILTGDYSITATSAGYFASTTTVMVTDSATATVDFSLDPLTYGAVSGVVTNAETGDPVSGARVQVGAAWWDAVYTNGDGEYTVEDVVTGDQGVWVTKWGYFGDFAIVEVLEGETSTHDVDLTPW